MVCDTHAFARKLNTYKLYTHIHIKPLLHQCTLMLLTTYKKLHTTNCTHTHTHTLTHWHTRTHQVNSTPSSVISHGYITRYMSCSKSILWQIITCQYTAYSRRSFCLTCMKRHTPLPLTALRHAAWSQWMEEKCVCTGNIDKGEI